MLKTTLRRCLGKICTLPPLASAARKKCLHGINVGFSHYYGPDQPYLFENPESSLDHLRHNLRLLSKHFTFSTLDEVLQGIPSPQPDRPRIALTLDDGFDIIRSGALAVFNEFGVKLTLFVISDCIDNRQLMWRNRLKAIQRIHGNEALSQAAQKVYRERNLTLPSKDVMGLSRQWRYEDQETLTQEIWKASRMPSQEEFLAQYQPYLSLQQLHMLQNLGHAIGFHTRSHPFSHQLNDAEVQKEYDAPLARLCQEFGLEKPALSYPYGVRLPPQHEQRLYETGKVGTLMGIQGFSASTTPRWSMERASFETDSCYSIFAGSLLGSKNARST